jgi:CBS domain-containing protein
MSLTDTVHSVLRNKNQTVYFVRPTTTVYDALEIMADNEIGSLLVVSCDGILEGIISERDYARKVILLGKSSKDTTVAEIMTSSYLRASPGEPIEDCMRIMTVNRVRHLPVMHSNTVLGIISLGDLVNWVISAQQEEIAQLNAYVAGAYPR